MSNEIYADLDGANYENTGIPPNISVNYSTDKDIFLDKLKDGITKKKDEAIEMALKKITTANNVYN